jgi:nucleoside-diphosphate-sugar epimerase
MIHIRDLAQFVFKIPERPPNSKYIFAIDGNKDTKKKKLMEAIFRGVKGSHIQVAEN